MERSERPVADNPRAKANFLSILTFWYMLDLFRKGRNKVLEISDLYKPMKEDESGLLGNRLEK